MRKFTMIMASAAMVLSLAACSVNKTVDTTADKAAGESSVQTETISGAKETETTTESATVPETIVVSSLNGEKETIEVEVPYDPQRVAVLDMAVLDIMDGRGLEDRVAGTVRFHKTF